MHPPRRSTSRAGFDAASAATIFKALADRHRLAIFSAIAGAREPICVCHLGGGLPLLQPTVSHHLKVLREAGLVESERRGTWVYYRLADRAFERLRKHIVGVTRQGWDYEDASLATHARDRRKREVLSKLAERTPA